MMITINDLLAEAPRRNEIITFLLAHPRVCGWKEAELIEKSTKELEQLYKRAKQAVKDNYIEKTFDETNKT